YYSSPAWFRRGSEVESRRLAYLCASDRIAEIAGARVVAERCRPVGGHVDAFFVQLAERLARLVERRVACRGEELDGARLVDCEPAAPVEEEDAEVVARAAFAEIATLL